MNTKLKVNQEVQCAEDACRLRDRMSRIRGKMDREVVGLKKGASNLLDIKYQMRSHPWVGIGAALIAGFFIVPRRKADEKIELDDDSIQKLVERGAINVRPLQKKTSLVRSGVMLVSNALLRAGIAYAGQQIGKASGHAAAE